MTIIENSVDPAPPRFRIRRFCAFLFSACVIAGVWIYFGPLPRDVAFGQAFNAVAVVASDGSPLDAASARLLRGDSAEGDVAHPTLAKRADKLSVAIVQAEDKRFFSHPGVDLVAMGRAAKVDLLAGEVRQGGSTITQQLVKIRRRREAANAGLLNKALEMIYAVRLDSRLSKQTILSSYLSEAPFGTTVRGATDAANIYFGRAVSQLSWAQAAYLASLPNKPGRFDPLIDPQAALSRQRMI